MKPNYGNINRQKVSGGSNLAISDDLQGLLAPEDSPNCKNQFACLENPLSRNFKTLELFSFGSSKFF